MSKSLKARLDRAYQLLASAQHCPTCGLSLDDWPVEIYVSCIGDPEDQVYLPHPPDYSRCTTCKAPSMLIFWEPVDRVRSFEAYEDDDETLTP